jgi:hypothetical protein
VDPVYYGVKDGLMGPEACNYTNFKFRGREVFKVAGPMLLKTDFDTESFNTLNDSSSNTVKGIKEHGFPSRLAFRGHYK